MAKKSTDWRATFKKILAPRILEALRDDRADRIRLKAAQRRQCVALLRVAMTSAEIKKALARTRTKVRRQRAAVA